MTSTKLEPAPFDFRGGTRLEVGQPVHSGLVKTIHLPDRLYIELRPGDRPCVRIGARVMTHQRLTDGDVPSHAPTSGRITDIALRPSIAPAAGRVLNLSANLAANLTLAVDGRHESMALAALADLAAEPPADLISRVRDAGITGMGGGGFPTYRKLEEARQSGIETLIVNAAECEPGVSADTSLLAADADSVVRGACAVATIVGASRCLVGIEPRNADAVAALHTAIAQHASDGLRWHCYGLPDRYPAGSERSLIHALTGIALRHGERPLAQRLICFNVASLHALARALYHGEPLTRRMLSISGEGAADPGDHWVSIGHPIDDFRADPRFQTLHGGPIAGWPIAAGASVGKTTFSLHFRQSAALAVDPCIRCQRCADVCPERLYPERLLRHSQTLDVDALQRDGLDYCVECGACDTVCPSRIPLLAIFREAKSNLADSAHSAARAVEARARSQFHEARESARRRATDASREARLNRRRTTHDRP
jgi:electron transport complex protein RnfC